MGPSDLPKETPRPAEVRQVESAQAVEKILSEVLATRKAEKAGTKMNEVTNEGQVGHITLPVDWQRGIVSAPAGGGSSFMEYHPANNKDVQFGFFYRGRRIGAESAKNFRDVLDKPPHVLTAEEIKSLKDVFGRTGNPRDFNMTTARTEDLNGKRVLIIEGRFVQDQKDRRQIFVDSDGTGSAVQEIYYQAPKDVYQQYLALANATFKSIKWKR